MDESARSQQGLGVFCSLDSQQSFQVLAKEKEGRGELSPSSSKGAFQVSTLKSTGAPVAQPSVEQPLSQAALLQRWEERVRRGAFSAAVKGVGVVRVMGRAGDAPVRYPQIESLAALDALEPDELAAVQFAEQVVREHQRAGRSVVTPTAAAGAQPNASRVQQFDATKPTILILSRITGG
jgi:hypothetical protein